MTNNALPSAGGNREAPLLHVLLMDDLIGRQRLEDLAMLGRELTDAHQRLQDLLGRYKATKDEAKAWRKDDPPPGP